MGCTEPIALSLAAAKTREILGAMPTKIEAYICGNIIKNAKSVTVPNTCGLKGIEAAIVAGLVANRSDLDLEVLSNLTKDDLLIINELLNKK